MSGYRHTLVQHWNDWQLSGLLLLSLLLQLLLLGTAGLRTTTRPGWWRKTYFWSLHIGSKFIATYSLGILSRATTGDANADIQAFWAAILLIHLGGPHDFTALSLEDNKLWDRQCFVLSVQAATTFYVFFRYFLDPEFRRFIGPFVLISLAGLAKCIEQVLALSKATMEALIQSVLGTPDAGPDFADSMDQLDGKLRSGVLPFISVHSERVDRPNSAAREVDNAGTVQNKEQQQQRALELIRSAHDLFSRFKVLFADGIFSFKDRRESRALFLNKDTDWAFRVIEIELSFVYDRLYTKASVSRTTLGMFLWVPSLLLTLGGSIWVFATLHETKYRLRHRCVTYTLLAGAVFIEVAILARHIYSIWYLVGSDWLKGCSVSLAQRSRWSGCMAQSNLIAFCVKDLPSESDLNKFFRRQQLGLGVLNNHVPIMLTPSLASIAVVELMKSDAAQTYIQKRSVLEQLQSKSFWKKYKKTSYVSVQHKLKRFIFQEVKKKGDSFNERETTGRQEDHENFSIDCRGDWVLKEEGIDCMGLRIQDKEFDESLLLWHIATDLCFREEGPPNEDNTDQQDRQNRVSQLKGDRQMARQISNYLLYIMMVHPLMLSSSTTMATKRCRDTCAEVRRYFLKEHVQATCGDAERKISEENAHERLLNVETPQEASVLRGDKSKSVLWEGCVLAKELKRIFEEDDRHRGKKWDVICKVLVEMLCYAAVHCGGYQHAERLSEGGELITFVCLLMTHLGMGKHYRTEVGDAFIHLDA